jgi:hypothetical protein
LGLGDTDVSDIRLGVWRKGVSWGGSISEARGNSVCPAFIAVGVGLPLDGVAGAHY